MAMSTAVKNLRSRRKKLLLQLNTPASPDGPSHIEQQLDQINIALEFLDEPGTARRQTMAVDETARCSSRRAPGSYVGSFRNASERP
jgi:hypothetical protein